MTMAEGVDYSSARPGGAALAAAGKTFAVRYLMENGNVRGNKGLTNTEIDDLWAHGLAVVVVFESDPARAGQGRDAGKVDARRAQGLLEQLKLAHDLPIYFAVDYDATPSAVAEYFRGVNEVIGYGRTGVYGSDRVVSYLRDHSLAHWLWQTYAWSGGKVTAGIHLRQYSNGQNINGSVDLNRSYQENFGQLGISAAGNGTTPIQEDDMQADERAALFDLQAAFNAAYRRDHGRILDEGDLGIVMRLQGAPHPTRNDYGRVMDAGDLQQILNAIAAIKGGDTAELAQSLAASLLGPLVEGLGRKLATGEQLAGMERDLLAAFGLKRS